VIDEPFAERAPDRDIAAGVFNAGASFEPDPSDTITQFEWDFDNDGLYDLPSSSFIATHAFDRFSTFPVTLRVASSDGQTDIGGAGNDTLDASGAGWAVTLVGDTGADIVLGGSGSDYLYIDHLDTLIDAGDGYDALLVGSGSAGMTIDVSAANAEWVLGGSGADVITNFGDATAVALSGGGGSDILTAGLGSDHLYGNERTDTLVVTSNAQLILDFEAGIDRIDLTALAGIDDFAGLERRRSRTAAIPFSTWAAATSCCSTRSPSPPSMPTTSSSHRRTSCSAGRGWRRRHAHLNLRPGDRRG
jgi:Ca2+-binding RTX toxin-like protein